MWSHGLISDITYEAFTVICNYSQVRREIVMGSLSPACSGVISQVSRELGKHIDSYDVTLDVCLPSVVSQSERLNQPVGLSHSFSFLSFLFSPVSTLYLLIWLLKFNLSFTARHRENWRLCGGWNHQILEQEGRTESPPRSPQGRLKMEYLQRVMIWYSH